MVEKGLNITEKLSAIWDPPDHFYHLKRGGHVRALKKHVRSRYFSNIDLANFFGHVTKSKIIRALKGLKVSYEEADYIASVSTVRSKETKQNVLPFGFTQSPILASIVFDKSRLGAAVRQIRKTGVCVSVYVDDIILSANSRDALVQQYGFLSQEIAKAGFAMNASKSQPVSSNIRAFNIELSNDQLVVEPQRLEGFLTQLYQASNEYVTHGILGYVHTVNKDQAMALSDKKTKGMF